MARFVPLGILVVGGALLPFLLGVAAPQQPQRLPLGVPTATVPRRAGGLELRAYAAAPDLAPGEAITYHLTLFRSFLEKLRAQPDGDGSLLDHSMVLYGSGMSDGNLHNHVNLPLVLVGGGAGTLKGGYHIKYAQPAPMANLLLGILDKAGVHLDRFGDSSGRIDLEPLSLAPGV